MPAPDCTWESSDDEYKCRRPRVNRGGNQYWNACIFHLGANQKNEDDNPALVESFKSEFANALDHGETDFRGIRTPPGLKMSDFAFLEGQPPLHPNEYYDATGEDLPEGADAPPLDFREAEFVETNFSGAALPSESNFAQASFDKCDFEGIVVGAGSSFRQAQFIQSRGRVRQPLWDRAQVGASTSFYGARFQRGASLEDAWIGAGVDFYNTKFEGSTSFARAEFGKRDVMGQMDIGKACIRFARAQFSGELNLNDAIFQVPVSFVSATFNKSGLLRTRFKESQWNHAAFRSSLSFDKVEFGGPAEFSAATFRKHVDWTDVRFRKMVDFRGVHWAEEAVLTRCDFEGLVRFGDLSSPIRRYEDLLLTDVDFMAPALLHNLDLRETRFRRVNLTRVSFLGSQIEDCRFTACKLESAPEDTGAFEIGRKPPWWKFNRPQVLFDERLLRLVRERPKEEPREILIDKDLREMTDAAGEELLTYTLDRLGIRRRSDLQPGNVEKIALQLKRSLEASRDPIQAGDFHFAAMEMKRLRNRDEGMDGRAFLLGVYRYLNGYGEQYGRALLWLAVLFLLSSLFYPFAGLQVTASPQAGASQTLVQWHLHPTGELLPLSTLFWDWVDSALLTLQNMLPFRFSDTHVRTGSLWAHRYATLQTLIGTALFAFFALALRRRFQR